MNVDSHSIGTIGRYEVIIASGPRRRSRHEIMAGVRSDTCVWLAQGQVYCCWQGTVERIIADPACASAFLSAAECTDLAAMVAATRITNKVAAAVESFRVLCGRLRSRADDLEVEQLTHDERTRIGHDLLAAGREILEALRAAGYDVDDAAECLRLASEAGLGAIDGATIEQCPGCGALSDEETTPGCDHPDGCGQAVTNGGDR